MKKNILFLTLSIAAVFILSAGLLAQDKVDVSIKVKKDGKVIQDTTYQFDDASEARHAMMMMEVLSGDDDHMENVHYNISSAHGGSGHSRAMVFISEDGDVTKIKEHSGDSLVWVSEGEDLHAHGKKVIVMKSDDGNTFDILVDEDHVGGDIVREKELKVVVSGDEEGNWTVVEGDDEVKVKVMKIMEEEGDGENVQVIVIKKSGDCDTEHDADHDEDHDEDVEVEVKMIKKEKKK